MADKKLTFDELNNGQKEVIAALKEGKNCFITGDAGTGKTTVINFFLDNYCSGKEVLKTAYTALAADKVKGGRTTHSAFGIPKYPTVKNKKWSSSNDLAINDIIIIDEVSMIRIDYFEGFLKAIKRSNQIREMFGRKPIQLILSGDFFQLKPIATDAELKVLGEIYGCDNNGEPKIYAFESEQWEKTGILSFHLTESERAKDDPEFIELLNRIKYCTNPQETINLISKLTSQNEINNGKEICLFASNKKVNKRNRECLNNLDGPEYIFKAEMNEKMEQAIKNKKIEEKDIPCEMEIPLRPGARVMFTINDTSGKKFQNGSLGTFLGLTSKIYKGQKREYLQVELDKNHQIVSVPTEKEKPREKRKYYFEVFDDPICRDHTNVIQNKDSMVVWQIPLKLAYAITIHKSQGQTYDYVNFDPLEEEFQLQEGQLYVLLSRMRKIGGLYLINPIKPEQCRTSLKVINFDKTNKKGE